MDDLIDFKKVKADSGPVTSAGGPEKLEAAASVVVYDLALSELIRTGFKYSSSVHARQFRFIDCEAFTNGQLRVLAFDNLTDPCYSATSYIWDGLKPDRYTEGQFFDIEGVRDAHPINIEVLRSMCLLSQKQGATLLWLDLMGILQHNLDDKFWQMHRMGDIYQNCQFCIVIPGGLQRLVRMKWKENTWWATRHWTLQEVILPSRVYFMFEWKKLGSGTITYTGNNQPSCRIEKIDELAAYGRFEEIFSINKNFSVSLVANDGISKFQPDDDSEPILLASGIPIELTMFIPQLGGGIVERFLLRAISRDPELREDAIWKSIFMRDSLIPVDAIFSAMHLLGVKLDPSQISGKKDARYIAMIKLAQAYLRQGGHAHWLHLVRCPQNPHLYSTRGTVDGKSGLVLDRRSCTFIYQSEEQDKNRGTSFSTWMQRRLKHMGYAAGVLQIPPQGSIDELGYLNVTILAREVDRIQLTPLDHVTNLEENIGRQISARLIVAMIGFVRDSGNQSLILDTHGTIRGKKRWHIVKYSHQNWDKADFSLTNLSIGGPEPDESLCDYFT